MKKFSGVVAACAAVSLAMSPLVMSSAAARDSRDKQVARSQGRDHGNLRLDSRRRGRLPGGYKHLVVIYEENHSFDNLYGRWGRVHGERVAGLRRATPLHTRQVAQDGTAYGCLLQNDVNLTSPPLPADCADGHTVNNPAGSPTQTTDGFVSHFSNQTFRVDDFIRPQDTTCPAPGASAPNGVPKGSGEPGGCTRDLVHRFYQEQYQLNDGAQNRYVTGSDAVGLTMGTYRTKRLPVYRYLHSAGAPKYVVADHFFQAAFGGSFLNHQWLIAARSPLDTTNGGLGAKHSVLDSNAMVTSYPLYTPTRTDVVDGQLTARCTDPTVSSEMLACGNFAVNTVQPNSEPTLHPADPKAAQPPRIPLIDDTAFPNIGDRLSAKGIKWNWYSGGWNDAASGHPGPLFQFHHQPFNYFANYAEGAPGRRHLKDEAAFRRAARKGHLPRVSFVKPYGAENEHPGYASEPNGSDHLVTLLREITRGPQAKTTLVVVTYDEFGGQWDHVSPPGLGGKQGVHDAWGPGTRIPALVLSRSLRHSGVDHTSYDTTSILATIERSFGLAPLSTRDAAVNDLSHAVAAAGGRKHHHRRF